jgi:flavin reductase (DIM6/NTAB) family NADH-FMN oxidoreductase RutF
MDATKKRKALRLFSYGMYIMTSRGKHGYAAGTVTWLSQASFKPPLVMAAIRRDSKLFVCLGESRVAAIHILSSDQKPIAQKFFSPTKVSDGRINGEPFVAGKTSAPVLKNFSAYIECQVKEIVDSGGDHAVIIMEIVDAELRDNVRPLVLADSPWSYAG